MTKHELSNIAPGLFRCAIVAVGAACAACGSGSAAPGTDAGSTSTSVTDVRSVVAEGPIASSVPDAVEGVRLALTRTAILLGDDATPVMPLPSREELARSGAAERYKHSGAADLYLVPLASCFPM